MPHDPRLVKDEDKIEQLRSTIPEWIKKLQRPKTPCVTPAFGPLEGIRAVGTGQLIAQPYIGTKLAEFGAEVIHVEKPGGDIFASPRRSWCAGRAPTEAMRPKSRRISCRWGSISRRRAASSS